MTLIGQDEGLIVTKLTEGEVVLWFSRPDPFVSMWRKRGIAIIGMIWVAAAGYGFLIEIDHVGTVKALSTLIFFAIGCYVLADLFLEYFRARQTMYVITERRLIIAEGHKKRVRSIQRRAVHHVEKRVRCGRISLRIPTALVSAGEDGQKIDYTDLHGPDEGDRAYALLVRHDM